MADPLSYSNWVSQQYAQHEELSKQLYVQKKTAESVAAGTQPTVSDVTGWRNNIPVSESDYMKQQLYAQYVIDFVKKQ